LKAKDRTQYGLNVIPTFEVPCLYYDGGVSYSTMTFILNGKMVQMFFAVPAYTQRDIRVSLTCLSI
jgi:hypothetical protein